VLDNHSSHRSKEVREFISNAGVTVEFLPSYSSPLNCIEHVWSSMKRMWAGFMANQYAYDRQNLREDILRIVRRVQITPQLVDH